MYHLSIATPEKSLFDGEVISLTAPGTEGYLQILTNHAPIMTALRKGKLRITQANNTELEWTVSGGFLEVSHNIATLLLDSAEPIIPTNSK